MTTTRRHHTGERERLLTTSEAANRLGIAPSTLTRWTNSPKGPPAVRIGRRIRRYRAADIDTLRHTERAAR